MFMQLAAATAAKGTNLATNGGIFCKKQSLLSYSFYTLEYLTYKCVKKKNHVISIGKYVNTFY